MNRPITKFKVRDECNKAEQVSIKSKLSGRKAAPIQFMT